MLQVSAMPMPMPMPSCARTELDLHVAAGELNAETVCIVLAHGVEPDMLALEKAGELSWIGVGESMKKKA